MTTLLFQDNYSLLSIAGTAILSFGIGLLVKMGVINKQRKRILMLEDEMLSNHSKILELEKMLADSSKEKVTGKNEFDIPTIKTNREAKAS